MHSLQAAQKQSSRYYQRMRASIRYNGSSSRKAKAKAEGSVAALVSFLRDKNTSTKNLLRR
jgi:hypothetical protein